MGVSVTIEHVNVETQLTTETGLFDGVDDDEEDDDVGFQEVNLQQVCNKEGCKEGVCGCTRCMG